MPRPEKVQAVAEIKEQFETAQAVFLTEYRGIPVKEMGNLRRRLRESGADYKVVKMTLARRAADDLGIDGLDEQLIGPTALAFAHDDPVSTAKALRDYARDNENLVIKIGYLANKVLQPEEVTRLADIEPREVLLAKIAGAAQAPLANMASMLSSFTRGAATVFSQLLEKKEAAPAEESAVAAEAASAESEDSPDSPDSPGSEDSPDSADSPDEGAADEASETDPQASADESDQAEEADEVQAEDADEAPADEAEEE